MTNINDIMTIPLIGVLLYMVFCLYPKIIIDIFRDETFFLRRKLFVLASGNPELFNNKSYRHLERLINITLNIANELSLGRFLFERFFRSIQKDKKNEFNAEAFIKSGLSKIKDENVKKEFKNIYNQFMIRVFIFIFLRNFFVSILFLLVSTVLGFFAIIKELIKTTSTNFISAYKNVKIGFKDAFVSSSKKVMNSPHYAQYAK